MNGRIITTEQVVQQHLNLEECLSQLVRSDSIFEENRWISEGTVHARKLDLAFQTTVEKNIHLEDCVASTIRNRLTSSYTEQCKTVTTKVKSNDRAHRTRWAERQRLARREQTWCSFHEQVVLPRSTERRC